MHHTKHDPDGALIMVAIVTLSALAAAAALLIYVVNSLPAFVPHFLPGVGA
jgi:hypothetical protein